MGYNLMLLNNNGGNMIKDQDSVRAGMVNALQNGSGYDFIINNSYRMSKDDLARVAAECMMAVYSKLSEEDYDAYEKEVADSLENEYWDESDFDDEDEAMERA